MIIDTRIRPIGSFVVIAGDLNAEIPEFTPMPQRIWANEFCVGVGTLVDVDGETHLVVSDRELETSLPLAFDGEIRTPNRWLTISDAHLIEFASFSVREKKTRIRVWTNDRSEPDEILVVAI